MITYLVNLNRSSDRLENMDRQLSALNISYKRVGAVDGKALTDSEIDDVTVDRKYRKIWYRNLTRGEIGCFLSHRKCWELIVAGSENFGCIIEDDVLLSPKVKEFIKNELWIPEGVHLIQLSHLGRGGVLISDEIDLNNKFGLVRVIKPHHIGTQGYLIDKKAASEALRLTRKIESPVDEFLFSLRYCFGRKYSAWVVNPYVVKANLEEETTVCAEGRRNEKPETVRQVIGSVLCRLRVSLLRKFVGKKYMISFCEN